MMRLKIRISITEQSLYTVHSIAANYEIYDRMTYNFIKTHSGKSVRMESKTDREMQEASAAISKIEVSETTL